MMRKRNEAMDWRIYACAAARMLGTDIEGGGRRPAGRAEDGHLAVTNEGPLGF